MDISSFLLSELPISMPGVVGTHWNPLMWVAVVFAGWWNTLWCTVGLYVLYELWNRQANKVCFSGVSTWSC